MCRFRSEFVIFLGHNFDGKSTREVIADNSPDSNTQIQRYMRLTELVPELLDLVDANQIALRPAVELSYLTYDEQKMVYEQILDCDCTPSHAQTIRMRKFSEEGRLNEAVIESIMQEEKPNQKEKIHIPLGQLLNSEETFNRALQNPSMKLRVQSKRLTVNRNRGQ